MHIIYCLVVPAFVYLIWLVAALFLSFNWITSVIYDLVKVAWARRSLRCCYRNIRGRNKSLISELSGCAARARERTKKFRKCAILDCWYQKISVNYL